MIIPLDKRVQLRPRTPTCNDTIEFSLSYDGTMYNAVMFDGEAKYDSRCVKDIIQHRSMHSLNTHIREVWGTFVKLEDLPTLEKRRPNRNIKDWSNDREIRAEASTID